MNIIWVFHPPYFSTEVIYSLTEKLFDHIIYFKKRAFILSLSKFIFTLQTLFPLLQTRHPPPLLSLITLAFHPPIGARGAEDVGNRVS